MCHNNQGDDLDNTVAELKDFVRYPNGTWSAKNKGDGYFDDRVMSLAIAAYMCYMYPHDPAPVFSLPKSERTEFYVKS